MSELEIEKTVKDLAFEESWGDEQYQEELVSEIEALFGHALPQDMRWFLLNYGSLKLGYDDGWAIYQKGEAQFPLRFEQVENSVFIKNRYQSYLDNDEGCHLPFPAENFFPFSKVTGTHAPFSYRLLVNLNAEDYGSIWAVEPFQQYDNPKPSKAVRVAQSFTELLKDLGAFHDLDGLAKEHNFANLLRYAAAYTPSEKAKPNVAESPVAVVRQLLEGATTFVYDGAQSVVHRNGKGSGAVVSMAGFTEGAEFFAYQTKPIHGRATDFARFETVFSDPTPSDPLIWQRKLPDRFWEVTATSKMSNGCEIRETFLLAKIDRKWSILERLTSDVDAVKVKNFGTLTYDDLGFWKTARKIKPAFLGLPAEMHVEGVEDTLDEPTIERARAFLDDESLKDPIGGALRSLQHGPWADHHDTTLLEQEEDIWKLVKKTGHYVRFQGPLVQIDLSTRLDDEHHISIVFEDGAVRLKDF